MNIFFILYRKSKLQEQEIHVFISNNLKSKLSIYSLILISLVLTSQTLRND